MLFIGFSFEDRYVCELLTRIERSYLRHAGRTHFALLPDDEARARGRRFFGTLGVTPITFSEYGEIPRLLGRIYEAGLAADQILDGKSRDAPVVLPGLRVRTHAPTGDSYRYPLEAIWPIARRARDEAVVASFVRAMGESGPHPDG